MAKKNEHHFVPRFYLKRFSEDQRRINILHIGRDEVFLEASIRGECKAHKLYGWDNGVEDALMDIEGAAAEIIRQIDATNKVPMLGQGDYQALLTFVILQRGRTIEAANSNDAMTDFYFKIMAEEKAKKDGVDLSSLKIVNEYGVALPLKISAEISMSIRHLDIHIFSNGTDLPFITSDNPVALHNHYCEGVYHRGVLGWASLGIQVFWPISPTKLLLLYDRRVYKVGTTRKSNMTGLTSTVEVEQINALQIANATEKLYFQDNDSAAAIQALVMQFASIRKYERYAAILTEAVPDGERMSQIMHNFERMCPLRTTIRAIQLRKDAKRVPLHDRNNSFRNWAKAGYPERRGDIVRYPLKTPAA